MPRKRCHKMDEKLRRVSRFPDVEKIAALCREFGISRVTGHKIIDRYRESGLEAFTESLAKGAYSSIVILLISIILFQ